MEAVRGVTAAQAGFREGAERWSIAEVLEHLVVWESFMRGAVERALGEPAAPEKSEADVAARITGAGAGGVARQATEGAGGGVADGSVERCG